MFKTFALTATLAISAAFIGYNADKAATIAHKISAEVSREITAINDWRNYNPETAFKTCLRTALAAPKGEAPDCQPDLDAWVARDGEDKPRLYIASAFSGALLHAFVSGLADGLASAN
jgi:hypothetical protein